MIGGLETREFWMLVGMILVASFFSVVNYSMTKWGIGTKPKLWSIVRRIIYGTAAGFIVWIVTWSGAVPHELGLGEAAIAGFFAEKTISGYMNRKARNCDAR